MRTPCRVLAILGFVFLGTPAIASADWQLTPFLGFTFKGDTTLLDFEQATDKVHWTFGGSVAFIGGGPVGVEGLVSYTPGFFQQDHPPLGEDGESPVDSTQSRTLAIMGNVVLTTPRKLERIRTASVRLRRHRLAACDGDRRTWSCAGRIRTVLGYNVGGGAVGFLTDRVGAALRPALLQQPQTER